MWNCLLCSLIVFFFYRYGEHRDLHVLTHSVPTRRSSDRPEAAMRSIRRSVFSYWSLGQSRATWTRSSPISSVRCEMEGSRSSNRAMSACASVVMRRSEEHTSELQSLMRISYAVFCLQNKTTHIEPAHLSPNENKGA